MSEDSREPFSRQSATSAFKRQRHPLRGILDVLCLDSCPDHWRIEDGVLITRHLQVSTMTTPEVCAFVDAALPGSDLGSEVAQTEVAPQLAGVACGYQGTYHGATLTISVLRSTGSSDVLVYLDGRTGGWACRKTLALGSGRPGCAVSH